MRFGTLEVGNLIKINENCNDKDVSENFIYKVIEIFDNHDKYENGIDIIDNAGDKHFLTFEEFDKVTVLRRGDNRKT